MLFGNKKTLISLFIGLACFLMIPAAYCFEDLQQVPALIHISSTVSDGRYEPEQIARIAEKKGFKIVVFTEREVMRWEYGLWPLRKIIKKVIENNSLSVYGIKKYLNKINELQNKNPNMVLISGIESTPFYYWSGSIFKKNFTLHNAHKHLLIIGLDNEKDIKNLPIVANSDTLLKPFKLKDILKLWPIAVIFLGICLFLVNRKKFFRNSLEALETRQRRMLGLIVTVVGFLFLLNNFPYRDCLFDQYHGDQGVLPYQNMIDYVNQKKGLVFWAHPEAENISKTKYVEISTEKHIHDFYNTKDYTGFNVFYDGYNYIGRPGKLWDKVLWEYVQGKRNKPVWAIGGLAFDFSGDLDKALNDLRNIVLMDGLDKEGFMDALRNGKVYVIRGRRSADFGLEDFSIEGLISGQKGIMGQTIEINDSRVIINMQGTFNVEPDDNTLYIHLIKNGEIIKDFKNKGNFNLQYEDDISSTQNKAFYRLEISSHGLHMVSNPIFIR